MTSYESALLVGITRIAQANPKLRPQLVPIIRRASEDRVAFTIASQHFPKAITAARWASLTLPEKRAVLLRVAHRPYMERTHGLTKDVVRDGRGFMVYKIDSGANNSKFYEAMVVPQDGGFRVIRRWGALTDSDTTGKIDGTKFDEDPRFWFETENQAKRELARHFATRIAHGYVDAFGPNHMTPDRKKLPMGQYPVGLTRTVGFGWGTQSITKCIPGLRDLQEALSQAREEIAQTGQSSEIKDHLETALALIRTVAHEDSSMASKLMTLMGKPFRRVSGSPRFLPDLEGRALASELRTIMAYVSKQLSLCS